MAHHKDEFGPNEPDMNLYNGYPITPASMRRKLQRDVFGNSGWKNLKGSVRGLRVRGDACRTRCASSRRRSCCSPSSRSPAGPSCTCCCGSCRG